MSCNLKTIGLALAFVATNLLAFAQNTSCPGSLGPNVFPDGTLGTGNENVLPYDPGIAPGYWYTTAPPPVDGAYCIANSTDGWTWFAELFWLDIGDNSADPNGYMMVVNADYQPGIFYERTVEVCENTPYIFSADIINLFLPQFPDAILPNVDFLMDGVVVFSTGDIPMDMQWHTYEFAFTPPAGVSQFTFSLRNNAPGGFGNDLALDNISLRFCGPRITLPDKVTLCGESLNLQPGFEGNPWQNPFYQWETSLDNGQTWGILFGENEPSLSLPSAQPGQLFRLLMAGKQANLDEPFCRAVSNGVLVETTEYQEFAQAIICQGDSLYLGSIWYSQAGIHQISLTSSTGCDSFLTLNLTVLPTSNSNLQVEVCEGEVFPFGNLALNSTGQYTQIFQNWQGCDSLVTLHLEVKPVSTTNVFEQICEGEAFNGAFYHQNTVLVDTLSSWVSGCDSIVHTHLTVWPVVHQVVSAFRCWGAEFAGQRVFSDTVVVLHGQTSHGCDSIITFNVEVGEKLEVTIEGPNTTCFGEIALLNAGIFHSYYWSNEEQTSEITVENAGVYSVTVTDSQGCTATGSHLLVHSTPKIEATLIEPTCFGDEDGGIQLNLSGGIPPYLISNNGQNFASQTNLTGLESGRYKIVVLDSLACEARATIFLPEPPPFEVIASESQTLELGETVRLSAQATLPIASFEWTPSSTLSCNDCPSPDATPLVTTEYHLFAVNEKGCIAESRVQLVVNKEEGVFAPTAFSPNGDGINDFFTLYSGSSVLKIRQLNIFNRWGEEVFRVWNASPYHPSTHWDGTFRGAPAMPGVFVWVAEIEYIDGHLAHLKGDVVLMK